MSDEFACARCDQTTGRLPDMLYVVKSVGHERIAGEASPLHLCAVATYASPDVIVRHVAPTNLCRWGLSLPCPMLSAGVLVVFGH